MNDMKVLLRSLAYALERNLLTDRFVFRRTARAITSVIESGSYTQADLDEVESYLTQFKTFTEENLLLHDLELLFDSENEHSENYQRNIDAGFRLLELIRSKKGGPKTSS